MAEHKFNTASPGEPATEGFSIRRPLFDEEPLNLDVYGGLVVLDTGQIAEVTPINFIPEGGDTGLEGKRVQPLPFDVVDAEDGGGDSGASDGGERIVWREVPYDAATATIGLEMEHTTMSDEDGSWHYISPDGTSVCYPHGLCVEAAEERGHQPEILKNTTESGSPVKDLARGYDDFKTKAAAEKMAKRRWGVQNGMAFIPIGSYPEAVTEEDITEHPYVQMLKKPDIMPRFLEYAACVSEQLNIQWKNPEAGAFAINAYQMLQPVLNLVTAAAPGRDGSLHTTLRDHYENNPDFAAADNAADYQELAELVNKELGPFMDEEPYDWRPLEREYGSPSGGVITEAAPVDIESMLRLADGQLRRGETMTTGRTLGWHTDRWRPDKGVVEICNLSHAGDHPKKMPAAEETVIKTIQALQEYFDDPADGTDGTYDESWRGIIPSPDERTDIAARQRVVDASRVNSLLVAVFGKKRNVFDADWQELTPRRIFDAFVGFTDRYAPEPISQAAVEEIRATLQQPPSPDEFRTTNDVLAAFYRTGSSMTATEAIRMAKEKDDMNPEITMGDILQRMFHYTFTIHKERAAAARRQRQRVAGKSGALAIKGY